MAAVEPGKIRNVAVVGHRGTGKTSLVEAMLFQSGAINRLGTVEQGHDHLRLGRGRAAPADVAGRLALPLRVAGPQDQPDRRPGRPGLRRRHDRCTARGRGRARRRRAPSWASRCRRRASGSAPTSSTCHASSSSTCSTASGPTSTARSSSSATHLSERCVAVNLPIGSEHELTGIVDVLHLKAYTSPEGEREGAPTEIPAEMADTVAEYREKLLDAVVETDEVADGALPRGRGARRPRRSRTRSRTRSRAASCSRSPAASRRRTSARPRCSTCWSRASPRRRSARPRSTSTAPAPRRSSSRPSPTRSRAGSTSSASSPGRSPPTRRS